MLQDKIKDGKHKSQFYDSRPTIVLLTQLIIKSLRTQNDYKSESDFVSLKLTPSSCKSSLVICDKKQFFKIYDEHLKQNARFGHPDDHTQIYQFFLKCEQKLRYVLDTISNQDSESLQFSVKEIIDQTVDLAVIEMREMDQQIQIQKDAAKKPGLDEIIKLQVPQFTNTHVLREKQPNILSHRDYACKNQIQKHTDLPLQLRPEYPAKIKAYCSLRNRPSSAQSSLNKTVDFMKKQAGHFERNQARSKNRGDQTQILDAQFTTNDNSVPLKLPKHPQKSSSNVAESQDFDENMDFLINNLNNYKKTMKTQANKPKDFFSKENVARRQLNLTDNQYPSPPKPSKDKQRLKTQDFDLVPSQDFLNKQTKQLKAQPHNQHSIEDEFKLVMKYLKSWKLFVQIQKQKRKQKKFDMEMLVRAIEFHETKLVKKVLKSFRKAKIKDLKISHAKLVLEQTVIHRLKAFYFSQMLKKYAREQKRKYFRTIASSYFVEQRKYKCLVYWSQIAKRTNSQANEMNLNIKQSCPYAAEILFTICHDFYIGQSKSSGIIDAISFQYLALNQFSNSIKSIPMSQVRVRKHLLDRFNESVEFILFKKQERCFKYWLRFLWMHKSFRRRHGLNFKFKFFNVLKTKMVTKKSLRAKQAVLSEIHRKQKEQRCFEEWISLYRYYSKFTQSTYCYTQKKISVLHFKKKYFECLKEYWRVRQVHNQNKYAADSKFFGRYVKICFQNWAWFALQQKRLRYANAHLARKYVLTEKSRYFKALQRAFSLELSIKSLRQRHLSAKVFLSMRKRKEYKALRAQILDICLNKFDTSVQRRALTSLKAFIKKKKHLKALESLLISKSQVKCLQKVMGSLKDNLMISQEKNKNKEFIMRFYSLNFQRKVLTALLRRTQFQKDLKLKYQVLLSTKNEKQIEIMFKAMHARYVKRVSDKTLALRLKRKTENNLKRWMATKWIQKSRHLRECERILTQRRQKATHSDFFKLWRMKVILTKQHRFKKKCFDQKQRIRHLQTCFGAFYERIQYKIRSSRMKHVGSFFFLKNKLGKCLNALKRYSNYRAIKRRTSSQYQVKIVKTCFEEIKRQWWKSQQLKVFFAQRMMSNLEKAFRVLQDYAIRKIRMKSIEETLTQSKNQKLKKTAFKVLANPEVYATRDNYVYEQHEIWKIRNGLNAWRNIAQIQQHRRCIGDQIKSMSEKNRIQKAMRIWLREKYLRDLETNVAVPHLQNVTNKEVKNQVLDALVTNMKYQRKKKYVIIAYKESLQTKAVESLRWYANTKIHHRGLIKYMTIKRQKLYLQEVFLELKSYIHFQTLLNNKAQKVQSMHQKGITQGLFRAWKNEVLELKMLEPTQNFIDNQYAKNLKKNVFSTLYKNRSFKIIKKNMASQAERYYKQLMKRKAFENLAWYGLVHKKHKKELKEIASEQFKRIIINRWIGVLNNVQKIKDDIQVSGAFSSGGNYTSVRKESIRSSIGSITGDLVFVGDTEDKRSQDSIHAVRQGQNLFKSTMPPRPTKILRQGYNSASSQDFERSSIHSLNIQELNTSDELHAAHDLMSKHLKTLLQQNSDGKEVEILKNLISEIKLKYQLSRMGDGQQQIVIQENMTPVEQLSDFDKSLIDSPKKLRREMAITKYRGDLTKKGFMAFKLNLQQDTDVQNLQVEEFRHLQLKVNSLKSLRVYSETSQSLRAIENWLSSKHEMNLQKRALEGLKWYIDHKARKFKNFTLSLSHYIQRQYRLGMFAFKKHQLMSIMQHSIQSQVHNRTKQRFFKAWLKLARQNIYDYNSNQAPLQISNQKPQSSPTMPIDSLYEPSHNSNIKIQQNEPMTLNSNSSESDNEQMQIQKQDSLGFNNTNGTKFSQLEDLAKQLELNDNPEPYQGFTDTEDNEMEIQDQNRASKFVDNSLEDSLEQLFTQHEQREHPDGSSLAGTRTKGDTKITGQLIGSDFGAKKVMLDTKQLNAPSETESDF